MKQITVSIPDNLDKALRQVAETEGLTVSQLGLLCVQIGFPWYIEGLNRYQDYLKAIAEVKETE